MTDERKDLPLDVIRRAWNENVKPGAEGDDGASPWAGVECFGNEERAVKFARAIVTAARQSDEAGKREAVYEALTRLVAHLVSCSVPSVGVAIVQSFRDREYPLPPRECVLSDGSVVTYTSDGIWRRNGGNPITYAIAHCEWRDVLRDTDTIGDKKALKSFAAGVGR